MNQIVKWVMPFLTVYVLTTVKIKYLLTPIITISVDVPVRVMKFKIFNTTIAPSGWLKYHIEMWWIGVI